MSAWQAGDLHAFRLMRLTAETLMFVDLRLAVRTAPTLAKPRFLRRGVGKLETEMTYVCDCYMNTARMARGGMIHIPSRPYLQKLLALSSVSRKSLFPDLNIAGR